MNYTVGQKMRNKYTGEVLSIQAIDQVDNVIVVYVLGTDRFNMENMTKHWEVVDE